MFDKPFSNVSLYMSHPIGTNVEENCKKAIAAVKRLRNVFPEVDFYCPAESELPLYFLRKKNKVFVMDIVDADVEILKRTDGWFFYAFGESPGSTIEGDEAFRLGFLDNCNCRFEFDIEKANYAYLRKAFGPVIEAAKRRFRSR